MRSRLVKSVIVVGCLAALGACGGGSDSSRDGSTTVPTSTVSPAMLDELADADNVLFAAALLEIGDVDAAVAAGLVNPAEVDAASDALDDQRLAEVIVEADGS